jgi:hypothetical protein
MAYFPHVHMSATFILDLFNLRFFLKKDDIQFNPQLSCLIKENQKINSIVLV